MGDFNSPDIDWQTFASTSVSSDHLCDLIIDHNLFQLVDVPTHIYRNILDLIITGDTDLIDDLVVHPLSDFSLESDHFIITFSICTSVYRYSHRNKAKHTYNFNKADWYGLNHFIAMNSSDVCFYSDDIETACSRLKDLLYQSMDMFKQQHLSSRPQWFIPEIRHHLNKLHTTRRKVKRNPTKCNKATLKLAEDKLQLITSSRQAFEASLVDQYSFTNSNKIFRHTLSLKSSKSIPEAMSLDSNSFSDDYGIANGFNKYFYSVFTQSHMDQPLTMDI